MAMTIYSIGFRDAAQTWFDVNLQNVFEVEEKGTRSYRVILKSSRNAKTEIEVSRGMALALLELFWQLQEAEGDDEEEEEQLTRVPDASSTGSKFLDSAEVLSKLKFDLFTQL